MTSMREYLLEHHKSDLVACGMDSCDNFEHVMETTLQLCILRPLSHYVYLRIEEYYTSNGFLYQVQRSIQQGKLKKLEEFGIRVSNNVDFISTLHSLNFKAHFCLKMFVLVTA